MHVVKQNIEKLSGPIRIEDRPVLRSRTSLCISLPLSLVEEALEATGQGGRE